MHNLPPDLLSKREIVRIDIANDPIDVKENGCETNPKLFCPKKDPLRGPLNANWIRDMKAQKKPFMCCYKLVTIKFKVFGLESKIESYISKVPYTDAYVASTSNLSFCAFIGAFSALLIDGLG